MAGLAGLFMPRNILVVGALAAAVFAGGALFGQDRGEAPANETPANVSSSGTPANETPAVVAAEPKPTQGVVNFGSAAGTTRELIKVLLEPSWALVVLVAFFVLRKPLFELIQELKTAVPSRGISIDIGTFKLQLAERAPDGAGDGQQLFSRSPFELDDENPHESWPLIGDIKKQLSVKVSDYVADFWERNGAQAAADEMRARRTDLQAALDNAATTEPQLKAAVLAFAEALEASRFREADQFAVLIENHVALQKLIDGLKPTDVGQHEADLLILLAAGVACLQCRAWPKAHAIMLRIVWKDEAPFYVPAGAFWLAASYNHLLDGLEAASVESPDFHQKLHEEIDRAKPLIRAIEDQDFNQLRVVLPKGYYLREVHKDHGDVLSVVADHLPLEMRRRYLDEAQEYLERCAETIEGEPPSPLDQNNLADFYRQLGDLAQQTDQDSQAAKKWDRLAHVEIKAALDREPTDPYFVDTCATLMASESRYHDALLELAKIPEATALADSALNQAQWAANHLLSAKLEVAAHRPDDPRGVAFAIKILETLERFLAHAPHKIKKEDVDDIRIELTELLAFAYLMLPRGEGLALNAFQRLLADPDWEPSTIAELRARVGYATAILRSARQQRRAGSAAVAATLRQQGGREAGTVRTLFKKLPVDAADRELQRRNMRYWLDGLSVAQLLAEEQQAGRDTADATAAATRVGEDLAALDGPVTSDTEQRVLPAYRRIVARHALLDARLLIGGDAMLEKADTVPNVEARLRAARGVRGDLECLAELEQGYLRLVSARLAKGDPEADFELAVAAFERAIRLDVASLRRDASRALAVAYSMRASLPRKKVTTPAA